MLTPSYTGQFRRDLKRLEKSGNKDIGKLKIVIRFLTEERQLEKTFRDHPLMGNLKGRRECHIEPDWLLIYKVDKNNKEIIFERTGSHSDLFE